MNTNTNPLDRVYTPADIKELLGILSLIKRDFNAVYNEVLFDNVAKSLLEVTLRMTFNACGKYNVMIEGLAFALPDNKFNSTQLALDFDVNKHIDDAQIVSEEDHQTIQDAATIIETVTAENSADEREKLRLINKLKRGRAMDFREVVARYMQKTELIGQDLLSYIEQTTGVGNAFNGLRRTAASIAISRYPIDNLGRPLQTNAKYPGYVDAQNFIINNFKIDDEKKKRAFANSVLQAALKTYGPELIARVSETRDNRRKKYEEKGYPTK